MYYNEKAAYKDFSFTRYWLEQAVKLNSNDEDDDLDDEDLDDAEATKTD